LLPIAVFVLVWTVRGYNRTLNPNFDFFQKYKMKNILVLKLPQRKQQ